MSLLEAVHRVNVSRVATLLFNGADVNMTDSQGVTPLIISCERGELRMVNLLLEAKASTKMVTNDTQSSCLHIAAKSNAASIVERLLKVERSLEERTNCQGDTPLMLACLSAVETEESENTLAALLQPLDTTTTTTTTAENKATSVKRSNNNSDGSAAAAGKSRATDNHRHGRRTVEYLGQDDPRLRARNRHGHTALHIATFTQSPTAVRMLLEAGADCTVVDKAGRTAMQAALNVVGKVRGLREGFDACLKLLQERWAELEKESQERENLFLGELDVASGGGSALGAGKGRRSNNSDGTPVYSKKSTGNRKKKKGKGKSLASPAAATDRDGTVVPPRELPLQQVGEATAAAQGQKLVSNSTAERSRVEGITDKTIGGGGGDGGGMQKKSSDGSSPGTSDTEGETDDETGSHPSSEETDTATAATDDDDDGGMASGPVVKASVVVGPAAAAAATRNDAAGAASMGGVHEGRRVKSSSLAREKGGEIDAAAEMGAAAGVMPVGGADVSSEARASSEEDEEAWSIVARPSRKKKTATSAFKIAAMPALPARRVGDGVGAGAPEGRRGQCDFGGGVSSGSNRGATIAAGERQLVPSSGGFIRKDTSAADAAARRESGQRRARPAQPVTLRAGPPAMATQPKRQPPVAVEATANVPIPLAQAAAAAASPAVSSPLPKRGSESAAVAATAEQGTDTVSRTETPDDAAAAAATTADAEEEHKRPPNPPSQRPLNVNANTWTPPLSSMASAPAAPSSAGFVIHDQQPVAPYAPHRPYAPQGLQHQMMNQMQVQGQQVPSFSGMPPLPRPLLQPSAGAATRGGGGLEAGQGVVQHLNNSPVMPMMMHAASLPAPVPPPPPRAGGAWGHPHHHQPPPANNFLHHPGNSATRVCGGVMFSNPCPPFPPQHAINNLDARHGSASGVPVVNMAPPPLPPPTGVFSSPVPPSCAAARGDAGNSGGVGVLDKAQAMLEASSPQAAVVALKVEHLVWDVEAMRAGLSMGQLDTVKAFLLEQVVRIDEAKLEQVRVQERCKNEEQSNIMQNLQSVKAASSGSADTNSSAASSGIDVDVAKVIELPEEEQQGEKIEKQAEEDERDADDTAA